MPSNPNKSETGQGATEAGKSRLGAPTSCFWLMSAVARPLVGWTIEALEGAIAAGGLSASGAGHEVVEFGDFIVDTDDGYGGISDNWSL